MRFPEVMAYLPDKDNDGSFEIVADGATITDRLGW
jgi:hypothetical protein